LGSAPPGARRALEAYKWCCDKKARLVQVLMTKKSRLASAFEEISEG